MKTALQWFAAAIVMIGALLLIQEVHMPTPAESEHGSILRPYSGIARLFAATEHWQELTETDSEDDALAFISYPDYRVIPTDGSAIRIPRIVIANPIDLSQTIYKQPDPQGRRDFGSLLVTFLLPRDEDADESDRLLIFMHDVEQLLDQARAKADTLYPDESAYYRNLSEFELAIAAGECQASKLRGVLNSDDSDNPDPLVVMSCAFVAHWI